MAVSTGACSAKTRVGVTWPPRAPPHRRHTHTHMCLQPLPPHPTTCRHSHTHVPTRTRVQPCTHAHRHTRAQRVPAGNNTTGRTQPRSAECSARTRRARSPGRATSQGASSRTVRWVSARTIAASRTRPWCLPSSCSPAGAGQGRARVGEGGKGLRNTSLGGGSRCSDVKAHRKHGHSRTQVHTANTMRCAFAFQQPGCIDAGAGWQGTARWGCEPTSLKRVLCVPLHPSPPQTPRQRHGTAHTCQHDAHTMHASPRGEHSPSSLHRGDTP
jgi:hypothetical protein